MICLIKVGTLVEFDNDEYKIYIDINESKMEVKSYKNTKKPSKFEFKYTILKSDKFYKISGFYSSELDEKKVLVCNEFKTYDDGKYTLYVYFRPKEKRYGIVERNYGREIRLDEDIFKFIAKNYKFKFENNKEDVYYQLIGRSNNSIYEDEAPRNIYGGGNQTLKKEDIPKFILNLLQEELDDYYGFINETKNHLNLYSDELLNNTINKCLTNDNKPIRKLFKDNRKVSKGE